VETMGKKILITDDEECLRILLAQELNQEGFEAYPIYLKTKAYEWIIENKPDFIISDINSPVMSGFEFLKLLRGNQNTKNIPFIFVTGLGDSKTIKKAKRLGAEGFLSKPYDFYELLKLIKRVIQRREEVLKKSQNKVLVFSSLGEVIKDAISYIKKKFIIPQVEIRQQRKLGSTYPNI
jgi:DNA-binding response OmpR family regulator